MEHFFKDRDKIRAFALYKFRYIAGGEEKEVSSVQVVEALKYSLAKCDPNIDEAEVEDLVESIDKFHRGMLSLDDFVELFQKTFELLYFHKDIGGKYQDGA
jgi:hypothetical protein